MFRLSLPRSFHKELERLNFTHYKNSESPNHSLCKCPQILKAFKVIDSKLIYLENIHEESILILTMKFINYSANSYKLVNIFK